MNTELSSSDNCITPRREELGHYSERPEFGGTESVKGGISFFPKGSGKRPRSSESPELAHSDVQSGLKRCKGNRGPYFHSSYHPSLQIPTSRSFTPLLPRESIEQSQPSRTVAADIDSDVYEVEAIVGKKGVGPTAQYQVKWLGYDETTWEAPWDLDNCIKLVEKFEKAQVAEKFAANLQPSRTGHDQTVNHHPHSNPTQQMVFHVATPGQSGIERGHTVVGILAHKPKALMIRCLEDVDFLVNYAGDSPSDFVSHESIARVEAQEVAEHMEEHVPFPKFSTNAVHVGNEPDKSANGDIVTPVSLSVTFRQSEPGVFKVHDYARSGNPTRNALERALAVAENASHTITFGSGTGALTAIMHLLHSGDEVISMNCLYGGTYTYFDNMAKSDGVKVIYVDMSDLQVVKRSLSPSTRMVYLESPTNPSMAVMDIEGIVEVVKEFDKSIITVMDNSFSTPYLLRPLDLGVDIAYQSVSKYIGGHADVMMGSASVRNEQLATRLRYMQNNMGAIPSPFDCYLVLRSMKTLPVRMREHMRNGLLVAQFLDHHPCVEKVFTVAVSFGGCESVVSYPILMSHKGINAEKMKASGVTENLARVSVGLEDTADLIADLDQALWSTQRASIKNGLLTKSESLIKIVASKNTQTPETESNPPNFRVAYHRSDSPSYWEDVSGDSSPHYRDKSRTRHARERDRSAERYTDLDRDVSAQRRTGRIREESVQRNGRDRSKVERVLRVTSQSDSGYTNGLDSDGMEQWMTANHAEDPDYITPHRPAGVTDRY